MAFRHIGLALALAFAVGCQGVAGPTGDPGASGPAGPQGAAGPAGAQGQPGPRGASGTPGADGQDGQPGADGQEGADAPTLGQLSGTVTDPSGVPLAEVTVQLPQRLARTQTDAEGRFGFAELPMGVYTLTAALDGHLPFADPSVAVFPDQTTTLAVTLQPVMEGLITGRVLTADGRAVAGAEVFTDFGALRAYTDADGRYVLAALPTSHAVSAWAPGTGFGTASAVDVRPAPGEQVEVDLVLAVAGLDTATYVGSTACAGCHEGTYTRWANSTHASNIRPVDLPYAPGAGAVLAGPWEGEAVLRQAGLPDTTVRFVRDDAGRPAFELEAPADGAVVRYALARSHGAGHGRWKQRYQVRLGDTHRFAPFQYNEGPGEWAAYELGDWVTPQGALREPDVNQSFEARCQGCHSTGLQLERRAGVTTATYAELNTGCEKCHGPGSQHVLAPRADTIINPRRLYPADTFGIIGMDGQVADAEAWAGFQRAQEVCGQCHLRGASVAAGGGPGRYDFPWVEAHGAHGERGLLEPLSDSVVMQPMMWDDDRFDRVRTSRAHHQQYNDELSAQGGGVAHGRNPFHLVACFDCHDPHGGPLDSNLKLPAKDNTLCLDCHGPHGFEDDAAVIAHTLHPRLNPGTTGSGRCIGCHMPGTATSALPGDIRSHTFHVVAPHESAAQAALGGPAMPNSCDVCHVDDEDRGTFRYEIFFGAPEPVED